MNILIKHNHHGHQLFIDDQEQTNFGYMASLELTNTTDSGGSGIFTTHNTNFFSRGDVDVVVDFGYPWSLACDNPVIEIKRRIHLVNIEFELLTPPSIFGGTTTWFTNV